MKEEVRGAVRSVAAAEQGVKLAQAQWTMPPGRRLPMTGLAQQLDEEVRKEDDLTLGPKKVDVGSCDVAGGVVKSACLETSIVRSFGRRSSR